MHGRTSTVDGSVVVGRLANLLAQGGTAALPPALDLLVSDLGLRSAVLRGTTSPGANGPGELRAVAGDVVHAVPRMRVVRADEPAGPSVELPVGGTRRAAATLTVVGARPSQLPTLRAAAAVFGLALADPDQPPVRRSTPPPAALLSAAEADRDELADALHDGPVQSLLAARYAADAALRSAPDERSAAALAGVRDAVQEAVVAVRRTLGHLRPRATGAGGLAEALHDLSGRLEEEGGPALTLALDEAAADAVAPAVAQLLYRVVQAVSAGAAGPVRVRLRRHDAARGPARALLELDGGSALATPERWALKARALGGDLTASAGRLRLLVPLSVPVSTPSAGRGATAVPADARALPSPSATRPAECSSPLPLRPKVDL